MAVKDARPKSEWKPGRVIEEGIQYRGQHQFRVQIREGKRKPQTGTFETLEEARTWKAETEKKLFGRSQNDPTLPDRTTVAQAAEWGITAYLGRPSDLKQRPKAPIVWKRPNDKNLDSKWRWWRDMSPFRSWPLSHVTDLDLRIWVRNLLMEDVGDDIEDAEAAQAEVQEIEGSAATVSPQTIIHRLNALSTLIKEWRLANELPERLLPNPVIRGVRPPNGKGRDRRLAEREEVALAEATAKSTRPWLSDAVLLARVTAMRQTELAQLTWDRVLLLDEHPHAHLPKTKNGRARDVPLEEVAIDALLRLKAMADEHNAKRQTRIERAKTEKQLADALAMPTWDKPLPVETGRGVIHAFRDAIESYHSEGGTELEDLRGHDLRHESISRLFELTDMNETKIMAIVGHLSREMLEHYTSLRTKKLGAELPTADGTRGDPPGTIKLRPGKPAVIKSAEGKWVRLSAADEFLTAYARNTINVAVKELPVANVE